MCLNMLFYHVSFMLNVKHIEPFHELIQVDQL